MDTKQKTRQAVPAEICREIARRLREAHGAPESGESALRYMLDHQETLYRARREFGIDASFLRRGQTDPARPQRLYGRGSYIVSPFDLDTQLTEIELALSPPEPKRAKLVAARVRHLCKSRVVPSVSPTFVEQIEAWGQAFENTPKSAEFRERADDVVARVVRANENPVSDEGSAITQGTRIREAELTRKAHKRKLSKCHKVAYDSCQWANKERPDLVPYSTTQRFSQKVYGYAKEHYPAYNDPDEGIPAPGFDSWCRYIRHCEQCGYKGERQSDQMRSAVSRGEAQDLGHLTNKLASPD